MAPAERPLVYFFLLFTHLLVWLYEEPVLGRRESLLGDLEDREYDLRPPIAGRAL